MIEESSAPDTKIIIPDLVRASAEKSYGAFFQSIAKASSKVCAEDHLDLQKSVKRAELLERYTTMRNKKLLEIGSGFGTNLAMWIKLYEVDGYVRSRTGRASALPSRRRASYFWPTASIPNGLFLRKASFFPSMTPRST